VIDRRVRGWRLASDAPSSVFRAIDGTEAYEGSRLVRRLATRFGLLWTTAPAYAGLFVIHLRHSLVPLRAGEVPPDLGYSPATPVPLQVLQLLCLAYLFAVYGLTLSRWRCLRLSRRHVAWNAVAVALMAWTLLPANSSDVLEYVGFGRLVSVYHVSPYLHTYSEFTDEFAAQVTWDEPMPYGPVVLPIFALAGLVSQHGVLPAVYALKFSWLLVHLANACLIYVTAGSLGIEPTFALAVFAFNPLVVFEQVGNGHNDGLLVFFGLLAVVALQRGRERWAVSLAVLGTLVKVAGVLWLAGVVAILIRRRRWRALGQALAASAAGVMLILWLFPGCAAALTVLNSQWQYCEDSLHTVVIDGVRGLSAALGRSVDYEDVFRADRIVCSALFVAICAWRYCHISDVPTLIRELGRVMLVLLIGYAVSVYPWYVSWVVPWAALTDVLPLRRSILIACAALLMLYAVPYAWVEQAPRHALWSAVRLCAAFLVPLVVWVCYEIHASSTNDPQPEVSGIAQF
jgi:hypothetical protein